MFCLLHSVKAQEPSEIILDLDKAVYRVLKRSLDLSIARDEAQGNRYLVEQARLYPNPDFNYEVENFAGNRNWKGWKHREERYFFSQLIETAGKRTLRTQAAAYQYYASLVGYDVAKLIILNKLHVAFINVVAAQEYLALTIDQSQIAKEVLRIATSKVEAGKVSIIEQNKAEVAYANTVVQLDRAKTELKNTARRLSLLWADACPDFERVCFPFYDISTPELLEKCLARLCDQPEIVQSFFQYLNAKKNWRLEKAYRIPDVTLELGYKANYEDNNHGLIFGISVPIPLFNRNQGNIGKAYYDMLKTGDQGRELWLILEAKISISHEELLLAYTQAQKIKNIALPSASQAFELAQKGYREGKFEYLDVLDAQRTLFEVRENYIQALVNYHTRQADINYLNSQTD